MNLLLAIQVRAENALYRVTSEVGNQFERLREDDEGEVGMVWMVVSCAVVAIFGLALMINFFEGLQWVIYDIFDGMCDTLGITNTMPEPPYRIIGG